MEAARDLAGAEFAALGIPNAVGYLESFVHVGMKPETVSRIPSLPQGRGLLGVIIQERRSVRLANLQEDPRAYGFPPGHPPMTSFLGVPIMAGHDTLGNLYLTNKRQALEFSPEDQEIVELLASHAAIAIQNARLYEQVGRLAILEERTRIGMDLHDGVIQSIYAVGLTLESVRLALPEDDADAHQLLGYAVDGLNDAIRDIRNFILDLRPHRFTGDLAEGLGRLVREFRANTMIEVDFESLTAATAELSPASARAIFLTAQSALANVARHARAGRVAIALERQDNEVTLRIQDDGQGFDPGRQRETVGHGLSNMRARAEELEGRFQVQSAPGAGTTIQLTLPFR